MSSTAREHIPRLVSESRLAQGLPERVTDPAVLSVVAALLQSADGRRGTESKLGCPHPGPRFRP